MKRRGCPGSTAGTVLNRDRWRCRARKQTSPCSQRQAPASICTRSPPTPPTIYHSLTASTSCSCSPQSLCLQFVSGGERIQQFFFFSRALKMPFTSLVSSCICGEWTSGGARAETRASSGRLSGWRAVWDTLRSNAAVPPRLRRAWQASP